MRPEDRIAELEALVAQQGEQIGQQQDLITQQHEQITLLLVRVQELEGRLAKDSHNSSKPPSSDGPARRTRSLRKPSGRKAGGQLGHRGETLHLVAVPDAVVEHRPACCAQCQAPLDGVPSHARERRQVRELPPLRVQVTEHQALHVRCPVCGTSTAGAFPAEVPSRVQYGPRLRAWVVYLVEQQLVPYARVRELLGDLFGQPLSTGTLVQMVQQCAGALAPVEAQLKRQAQAAPILHNDETGMRVAGRGQWVHVSSTRTLTHYAVHPQRGAAATDAIGILPGLGGTSIHDGWSTYRHYTACRHALCNVHHLRELTFLEEERHQPWAGNLKRLLLEMKATVATARASGLLQLPAAQRRDLQRRYEALLLAGLAANPPPSPPDPPKPGRRKQSPARNLLERLWLQQEAVLAFLDDFSVPFDNNQAERDLRMVKVQQKISGCFRALGGAEAFCRIRSYLSTLRKQQEALLHALWTTFMGRPLYPALA
jgi:transposase